MKWYFSPLSCLLRRIKHFCHSTRLDNSILCLSKAILFWHSASYISTKFDLNFIPKVQSALDAVIVKTIFNWILHRKGTTLFFPAWAITQFYISTAEVLRKKKWYGNNVSVVRTPERIVIHVKMNHAFWHFVRWTFFSDFFLESWFYAVGKSNFRSIVDNRLW